MKLLRILTIPLLLLIIDGCVDPIDIPTLSQGQKLVVDGLVTNEPGPYTVKLFYSRNLDIFSKDATPVSNATISIIEDGNITRPLTEVSSGIYQTNANWQAEVGKSYAVRIVTSGQRTFSSKPQTLTAPGVIDSIYTAFEADGIASADNGTLLRDAIRVSIDARGANDQAEHLRWRFKGLYHARTFPELRTKITISGVVLPDPLPCSGYIGYGDALIKVGECTCCECWPTEHNTGVVLSDPQAANNAVFKDVHMIKIPVTGIRFTNLYRIEIEQYSLSPELYDFWKLIKIQGESAGSLFQPSAVKVRGNVTADNDKEEVLGVFAVCGVSRKATFVDRKLIPYKIPSEIITDGCQFAFDNAVIEKPSFWP